MGDSSRASGKADEKIDQRLAELSEQQQRIDVARAALEHRRQCPASVAMKWG
ncbi:hypothetical protein [Amycolatopsis palatopharyngis]|uniref:hypothetical protein n=1 Tax=Amycolatopsis palatopharyngis TaxID=187982 RepID=UPI001FEBC240|nr:hypothetical protein [Amycolatopsis palatopharyngis]